MRLLLPWLLLWLGVPVASAERPPRIAAALDDDSAPGDDGEALSKKSAFLRDKAERPDRQARAVRAAPPPAMITLKNVWTRESLAVTPSDARDLGVALFDDLVRCHFTNQTAAMDLRLYQTVLRAALRFHARTVEIVSGFRAPKYQLMLRKKGREVARDSEHPRGQALDFRLPDVPTRSLLRFVRSLRLGGVGYYPDSQFVHADVGRLRTWRGH